MVNAIRSGHETCRYYGTGVKGDGCSMRDTHLYGGSERLSALRPDISILIGYTMDESSSRRAMTSNDDDTQSSAWPPAPISNEPVEPLSDEPPVMAFRTQNLALLICLLVVTLGFYEVLWLRRVNDSIRRVNETYALSEWPINLAILSCGALIIFDIVLGVAAVAGYSLGLSDTQASHVTSLLSNMLNIYLLVLTFMVRDGITRALHLQNTRNALQKFWTLSLGPIYLQYRLNKMVNEALDEAKSSPATPSNGVSQNAGL
jgi:hypothetical protein